MRNRRLSKGIGIILLLSLLLATVVSPALAADIQTGSVLVISNDVEDDLYAIAEHFTLNATIHGDLIIAARTVTIEPTGVVEGDLLGIAQNVVIKGEVKGDARIAGAVLTVSQSGKVNEDLAAAGLSLELEAGSMVGVSGSTAGGDVLYGGSQALFAGKIIGDVKAATAGLEIRGTVNGKITAYVGEPGSEMPFSSTFIPGFPSAPEVQGGLTIGSEAIIKGPLDYTSPKEASIPSKVIPSDRITFHQSEYHFDKGEITRKSVSTTSKVITWFEWRLRWLATLLLVGLLLAWIAPNLTKKSAEKLQARPLHSLGWGIVSFFALLFALFALIVVMILLAIVLIFLTLGALAAIELVTGFLAAFSLVFGFVIAAVLISKIVVSYFGGRLILASIKPEWAKSSLWPLLLGLVIFVFLAAIPFYVGGLINFIAILLGLGALWMWGSELVKPKSSKPAEM